MPPKTRTTTPLKRKRVQGSEGQVTTKTAKKSRRTAAAYDSDNLDADDSDHDVQGNQGRDEDGDDDSDSGSFTEAKSKSKPKPRAVKPKPKPAPAGRSKRPKKQDSDAEEADEGDEELEEGQKILGRVVQAPTTGRVPLGQISQNTLDFLNHLKDPKCNDRDWFRLHEPVYRVAEQEWKDFIDSFTEVLSEIDTQIPPLPPKDVIHRIYRDVRFSNDKTPYKKGFSATFSRGGRKGIFAKFKPGNESIIAAGAWCPGKNELATIRSNINRNPRRLRSIISSPKFVEFFGEPKPDPEGGRRSIFGHEDELKVAPKGYDKDHEDIDLLKCRTFAVVHRFTDKEVLEPDFKERIGKVVKVMRPFVHCLNNMMTIQNNEDEDEGEDEDEDDGDGDGESEADDDNASDEE